MSPRARFRRGGGGGWAGMEAVPRMPMIWLDLKEAGEFAFNAAVKKVGVEACVRPAGGGEAPSGSAPGALCGACGGFVGCLW